MKIVDLIVIFNEQPSGDVQEVNSKLWAGRLKNICEKKKKRILADT